MRRKYRVAVRPELLERNWANSAHRWRKARK